MKNVMQRAVLAFATTAILSAVPAQASCWKPDQVNAAKVRDLETMLMVSALRCRNGGDNFLADYNRFVTRSRPALIEVNDRLRSHFAEKVGKAGALNAYDRYVTTVANRYGAGVEGLDCRDMASIVTAATSEGGSFTELVALAERADVRPLLAGSVCGIQVASRGQR